MNSFNGSYRRINQNTNESIDKKFTNNNRHYNNREQDTNETKTEWYKHFKEFFAMITAIVTLFTAIAGVIIAKPDISTPLINDFIATLPTISELLRNEYDRGKLDGEKQISAFSQTAFDSGMEEGINRVKASSGWFISDILNEYYNNGCQKDLEYRGSFDNTGGNDRNKLLENSLSTSQISINDVNVINSSNWYPQDGVYWMVQVPDIQVM